MFFWKEQIHTGSILSYYRVRSIQKLTLSVHTLFEGLIFHIHIKNLLSITIPEVPRISSRHD